MCETYKRTYMHENWWNPEWYEAIDWWLSVESRSATRISALVHPAWMAWLNFKTPWIYKFLPPAYRNDESTQESVLDDTQSGYFPSEQNVSTCLERVALWIKLHFIRNVVTRKRKDNSKLFLLKCGTVRCLMFSDFQVFSFIKHFKLLNHARVRAQKQLPTNAFKRWHYVNVLELVLCESACHECEILPDNNNVDGESAEAVLRLLREICQALFCTWM